MGQVVDHYSILGVDSGASQEEIRAAYIARIRKAHPDAGGSEEEAKQITAIYKVLSTPNQRAAYDRDIGEAVACPVCGRGGFNVDTLMWHFTAHVAELASASIRDGCEACGRIPAEPLHLSSSQGFLFWRQVGSYEAQLCRECGYALYRRVQNRTWLGGWWSPISAISSPFILAANAGRIRTHRLATRADRGATPTDAPERDEPETQVSSEADEQAGQAEAWEPSGRKGFGWAVAAVAFGAVIYGIGSQTPATVTEPAESPGLLAVESTMSAPPAPSTTEAPTTSTAPIPVREYAKSPPVMLSEAVADDPGWLVFDACSQRPFDTGTLNPTDAGWCNGMSWTTGALNAPAYYQSISDADPATLDTAYCEGWRSAPLALDMGTRDWPGWDQIRGAFPPRPDCETSVRPEVETAGVVQASCDTTSYTCTDSPWPDPKLDQVSAVWCAGAADGVMASIEAMGAFEPPAELWDPMVWDCTRRGGSRDLIWEGWSGMQYDVGEDVWQNSGSDESWWYDYDGALVYLAEDGWSFYPSSQTEGEWVEPEQALSAPATTIDPPPLGISGSSPIDANCMIDGIPLWGNVYVTDVSSLADFTVALTSIDALADLTVYITESSILASSCGIWHEVTSPILADFSVTFTDLDALADFTAIGTDISVLAGTN